MDNTPVSIMHDGCLITTDKAKMYIDDIHKWLSEESYWCKYIPYQLVKKSFDNSFCIGVLKDDKQIGYARLITDYTTFAYLADVYIEDAYREKGLGKKMVKTLLELDWVQGLRRIMLATIDAHGLYTQYGFSRPVLPERIMEIIRPAIYGDVHNACK